MKRKRLFNDNWEFTLLDNGSTLADTENAEYRPVPIPHDWLIYDVSDLYRSGDGWYRKYFTADDFFSRSYILYFDGIYMDSTIYVNGKEAVSWTYGYSSFSTDISEYLTEGENRIDVCVRYRSPNSRWYSGAGIFRNVWLYTVSPVHLNLDGIYISPDASSGDIYVNTEAVGISSVMPPLEIIHTVYDNTGKKVFKGNYPISWSCMECTLHLDDFSLWSLEEPVIYTLHTELAVIADGTVLDHSENSFGFRTIRFDPDEGFSLNGKHMKLKGVCLHHDLGCLGSALNYSALERQLMLMKDMGANSIRTSHNMPAPELLEICDRIGLLVNCESFDCWERPKTEFDNARFFAETAHRDVKSWIKRDRNHPCVILWSIGNEILDTHIDREHGYEIAEKLVSYVRECDYKNNAFPTIGSNYIEWENAQRVGKMIGISGYNYSERCYDEHHIKYPDTVIYGSETASAVRSRGIYHFPASIPRLSHEDKQCSSLANSTVRWGKPAEQAWIDDRDRKFCAGQYVWAGIDYIGEPTPYDTKNSYFGIADTACLPKDIYYFYQSVWADSAKPMIHLLPYWDFNEEQEIDVIAYTNAASAELFVNGRSMGRQYIDHEHGSILHGEWRVRYERGSITAKGYDRDGRVIAEETKHSFGDPVKICLSPERESIFADGSDTVFIDISVLDENDIPVENALNRIKVSVSGAGYLVGLDNGDSADTDDYKCDSRRLFSGRMVAAVRADTTAGDITISAYSEGLKGASLTLTSEQSDIPEGISLTKDTVRITDDIHDLPVRKIDIICDTDTLTKDSPSCTADVVIHPGNASYDDIVCGIYTPYGVPSEAIEAVYENNNVRLTGKGDGEFILRISCKNGTDHQCVISEKKITCTGMGSALKDPYTMISASLFDRSSSPVNIVEANALSGFSRPIRVYFSGVDFGRAGSDNIILYIGNNRGHTVNIDVIDVCGNEERVIASLPAADNGRWNSYEPIEYTLPERLHGIHTLAFGISEAIIFGGFAAKGEDEAFALLYPAECDEIYGDDYKKDGSSITGIGNNVLININGIDFGADGASGIMICGRTQNKVNPIQLRTVHDGISKTQLLEFRHSEDHTEQVFTLEKLTGKTDVSFVFLPGSSFDFDSFRFIK